MIIDNFKGLQQPLINTISDYLKKQFGHKTIKLSIDGGFTCPNRDGSKGYGGCIFCSDSGSGDMASSGDNISKVLDSQIAILSKKWPDAKYIAYFQSHTNTYAPVEILREKYMDALSDPRISGIVIATRPDCLGDDVLNLLSELNKKTLMWVELGLQSIHPQTSEFINRGYNLSVYDDACNKLSKRGIKFVTHIILGLPGESRQDMIDTVKYVCKSGTWGIKLHLLNITKNSRLAKTHSDYTPFESIDDYVGMVCDLLEIIPYKIIIHRLTADTPRKNLISPLWSYKKRTILNGIYHEMFQRGSIQGCKAYKLSQNNNVPAN